MTSTIGNIARHASRKDVTAGFTSQSHHINIPISTAKTNSKESWKNGTPLMGMTHCEFLHGCYRRYGPRDVNISTHTTGTFQRCSIVTPMYKSGTYRRFITVHCTVENQVKRRTPNVGMRSTKLAVNVSCEFRTKLTQGSEAKRRCKRDSWKVSVKCLVLFMLHIQDWSSALPCNIVLCPQAEVVFHFHMVLAFCLFHRWRQH